MRIAEIRSSIRIVLVVSTRGRNVAIAVRARLRDISGQVWIGMIATFAVLIVTRFVGAALVLVVAGLVFGAGIFRVGGFDLRFGFCEFVLEINIRLFALVLVLVIVLGRAFAALVFARTLAGLVLALAGARLALTSARAFRFALAGSLAIAFSSLRVRLAGPLILA